MNMKTKYMENMEHGMFEEWLSQCAKKYHTNIIGGSYAVRPAKKGGK